MKRKKNSKPKQDVVVDIWRSHRNYLAEKSVDLEAPNIVDYLASAFCPGPYYYYILDSPTLTMDVVCGTKEVLGIDPADFSVEKFVGVLHPDDVNFFLRCEDVIAHFLTHCVAPRKIVRYKINYCLRQRTIDGSYRLFLLQTLTLKTTAKGELLKVFGTQADISHITDTNNRRLSFIGLQGEPSYLEIDVFDDSLFENFIPHQYSIEPCPFTKREMEIIRLLGLGLSTEEIASKLYISFQTVITHRKNLLRKSEAKNTTELVADSVRKGYI